jgi:hypothetical protein
MGQKKSSRKKPPLRLMSEGAEELMHTIAPETPNMHTGKVRMKERREQERFSYSK